MKLKKCSVCKSYTLKQEHCSRKTLDAGHKFVRVKREDSTKQQ